MAPAPSAAAQTPPTAPQLRLHTPAAEPRLDTPQLSVVIVNFCQWRNTARLTRQLCRADCVRRGAAEVVIVDNHSPPHPVRHRLRHWAQVSLRAFRRNRGFARAVNEGCRLGEGQWVLLLNPDMSVGPNFLDAALA